MVVLFKAFLLIAFVFLLMKLFPSKAVKRNQNMPKLPIEGVGGWLLLFFIIFSLLTAGQLSIAAIDMESSTKENAHIAFFSYINTFLFVSFKLVALTSDASSIIIPKFFSTHAFDMNEAVPAYLRTRAAIGAISCVIVTAALFILGFRQKHSTIKFFIIVVAIARGGAFLTMSILAYTSDIPASRAALDAEVALRQFAFTICLLAIFAVYMYKSKRARNTYLKPGESPPMPIMPSKPLEPNNTTK